MDACATATPGLNRSAAQLLPVRELNALGREGWELVGIVALPSKVQFYFKRARS